MKIESLEIGMKQNIIFKSFWKSHKFSLIGIFAFVAIVCAVGCSLFTVLYSTSSYERSEIRRGEFGDISFWLTKFPSENEQKDLAKNIYELEKVESLNFQNMIMANYEISHTESDSEGCFIVDDGRYKKLGSMNEELKIGECLVPFSFSEIYEGVGIGDFVEVVVGRNGLTEKLKIVNFFEDPFMGSTMVGMKTILISQADFEKMALMISENDFDALARDGLLLHVKEKKSVTANGGFNFNKYLNENSDISLYTEDVHSTDTMIHFMLLLSNSFAAMFGTFALVLFLVTVFVLSHAIRTAVNEERSHFGIYKELGYESKDLAENFSMLFMVPVIFASLIGAVLSFPISKIILKSQRTTTSLFVPVDIPYMIFVLFLAVICTVLFGFVFLQSSRIRKISPLDAIRLTGNKNQIKANTSIHKKGLLFWMALRQIESRKRDYFSTLIISLLLVLFSTFVVRINVWLGPNGEGLMYAFNPTDMHFGVQSFGEETIEDFEEIINQYSQIKEHYVLGMPTLRIDGKDYTANVTDAPEFFQIFDGRSCTSDNEIVITEFLMHDLGLKIGDTVKIGSRYSPEQDFVITGTYQCANDTGENFGMTKEGYLRIGRDNPALWCHHYFLHDEAKKFEIMNTLEEKFGSDVHVHENNWPGLYGILRAMKMLIVFMYVVSGIFVLIAIILSSKKIIAEEKNDLSSYRLLGFSFESLRWSFVLRFLIVAIIGSVIALVAGALISDPLIDILMRSAGIAGFASHMGLQKGILPAVIIVLMFIFFAWIFGERIRKFR